MNKVSPGMPVVQQSWFVRFANCGFALENKNALRAVAAILYASPPFIA